MLDLSLHVLSCHGSNFPFGPSGYELVRAVSKSLRLRVSHVRQAKFVLQLIRWFYLRDLLFVPYLHVAIRQLGMKWVKWYEPPHDKTNKMTVRPAKTRISLGIRPVWSESSLCAQWVAKDRSFLHADSDDSDQTGRMPRLIWVFAGRTTTLLVLSWGGSFWSAVKSKYEKFPSSVIWPIEKLSSQK